MKRLAGLLLLLASPALAGPNVLGNQFNVTKTPVIVGSGTGRGFLSIEIDSVAATSIYCGPYALVSSLSASTGAPWWEIEPGKVKSWGILYQGLYTAEVDIGCMQVASNTPIVADYSEEGGMPDRTASPTVTGTITPTPANTATPANTNTATPVDTATNTRTRIPTRTKTPTPANTGTITPTPASTATSTPIPTAT